MPRDRVGLAIGKDRSGDYLAVVAMSTEVLPTNMRDLAYSIGQEIGNNLTEEEQTKLRMKFKGKQSYYLGRPLVRQAWDDFYKHRTPRLTRAVVSSLYTWSNTRKAKSIAEAIAEYMHLPDPIPEPVEPVRDPRLPDNVFESKIILL